MKKVTAFILFVILGLALSIPTISMAGTKPAHHKASKNSQKGYNKKSLKQQKKSQKKNMKSQKKATKSWKKQQHSSRH